MSGDGHLTPAEIRARLTHPVIDADGHWLEYGPVFSSDIGHFDVSDMLDVLPEAYELVEDGLITVDDFRDFTFANAVRLWGTGNPSFFAGTAVEKAAAAELNASRR